ncbi:uncharacterized protein LOC8264408 isoform X1 [Ricinus communis]|uniref:uncharacterized protein LOC8264408 isoform X1 n=1 Tax=Ricinus communis TaxID=3988 RepID=UPI000772BD0B|nr:uncharacterized protein LOC8264408 isoform X1 [Ricinus communis]|eukprot:XP_015584216.1 uncharacterized protein LOC8264408 [Ricinus communis]
MSALREGKKKRQIAIEPTPISSQDKKELPHQEEEEKVLKKEIQDLRQWTEMIDVMNDEQLKEYLKNRPDQFKTVKIERSKPRQRVRKTKSSTSTGIMASVWKFHREDDN